MGSIIAHDVLRSCENSMEIVIQHLITIGSPLGLPYVSKKIRSEFGETRTPKNVYRWSNIADPGDKVALDIALEDDFSAPENGRRVVDILTTGCCGPYEVADGGVFDHRTLNDRLHQVLGIATHLD